MKYTNKLLLLYIVIIVPCNLASMKLAQKTAFECKPTTDFFTKIPTDVAKIIIDYVAHNNRGSDIHALGLTNTFFAKHILRADQSWIEKIIQARARRFRGPLSDICPHDLVFAAAFELNSYAAKKWLQESYFTSPDNFKIVTQSFFALLTPTNPDTKALQACITKAFPKELPAKIQHRIHHILKSHTAQYSLYPASFIATLYPEHQKHETTCLDPNNDNDPDNAAFLSLVTDSIGKTPKYLLEALEKGANPNNYDSRNWPPILLAIVKADQNMMSSDHHECLTLLLDAGANPDIHLRCDGKNGMTPLIYAINHEEITSDTVELLLHKGTDPNFPDSHGNSPLAHALKKLAATCFIMRPLEKIELLVAAGAHFNPAIPHANALLKYEHLIRPNPKLGHLHKLLNLYGDGKGT